MIWRAIGGHIIHFAQKKHPNRGDLISEAFYFQS